MLATKPSGTWLVEVLDFDGTVGEMSSIAVNATDDWIVSYYDLTNEELKVARHENYAPGHKLVCREAVGGLGSSLAVDHAGNSRVSHKKKQSSPLEWKYFSQP
jgi:hypothetical protein